MSLNLFATAPTALAPLLATELRELGVERVKVTGAGVEFSADLSMAYRICLWSRLASRVLLPIARVPAANGDQLYEGAHSFDWSAHLNIFCTFAIDCTVRNARIKHSHYAALRVKDAIVDQFREKDGRRPSIDTENPDIRIHLHLRGNQAQIAIDLSGGGLHRRGYRTEAGAAPLRETLAAAMLRFSAWPNTEGFDILLDPLCGSGTLLIEAAMIAGDIAPAMDRGHFGFLSWPGHDAQCWQGLLDEATERRAVGIRDMPPIIGSDHDIDVINIAMRNVGRAGLAHNIELRHCALNEYRNNTTLPAKGLLVTNPPYGPRLEDEAAKLCAQQLQSLFETTFKTWTKTILMPDDSPWPKQSNNDSMQVNNGALACRIHFLGRTRSNSNDESRIPRARKGHAASQTHQDDVQSKAEIVPSAQDVAAIDTSEFVNRIKKNQRRLRTWLKRDEITCYRIYDADLPQFALAIDIYNTFDPDQRWVLVHEYAAPASIDVQLAAARRDAALLCIPDLLEVAREQVLFKTRERQRGNQQYHRQQHQQQYLQVLEGGITLQVNLRDFLDSGLFLDHRPIRQWIREHSQGCRFLNLFAYTSAASVHAAAGGAVQTLSVDLSNTYSQWAERNLALNGYQQAEHQVLRADCMQWLSNEAETSPASFDLIFLDPPTFSNSKRMQDSFDVQRDHKELIEKAMTLLDVNGTLIFSSNRRGMNLDDSVKQQFQIRDWTKASLPMDFTRGSASHHCWMLRHQP